MLQRAPRFAVKGVTKRAFSTAQAAKMEDTGAQPTEKAGIKIERPISHTLRNQHIKFIPPRKPNFNLETPDGRVSLIYKSGPKSKLSPWHMAFGVSAPATFLTNMLDLPMDPTI